MISSKTLKKFVKMHEYKLNAKIYRLRAERLESKLANEHWSDDCLDEHHRPEPAAPHAPFTDDIGTSGRPELRYFRFIPTSPR